MTTAVAAFVIVVAIGSAGAGVTILLGTLGARLERIAGALEELVELEKKKQEEP